MKKKTTRRGYHSPFSHDDEHAEPYLYTVDLDVASVRLSATEHTGLHEYTFKGTEPALVIDVGHQMGRGIVSEGEISLSEDGMSFEGSLIMRGEISDNFPIYFMENSIRHLKIGVYGKMMIFLSHKNMPLCSRPMKRILFFWDCGQNFLPNLQSIFVSHSAM